MADFYVSFSDWGGESMSCYSGVEMTRKFKNMRDALIFYRDSEIPRILDNHTASNKVPFDLPEAYLGLLEDDERGKVDHLLGLLDRAKSSDQVSPAELERIREEWNACFKETNPELQILAWGSLSEVLNSEYFSDIFKEEIDSEEETATKLKNLLDAKLFNDAKKNHMTLALKFLEQHASC